MKVNFNRIEKIFERAEKEKRASLLEQEVYAIFRAAGIQTPGFLFVKKGKRLSRRDLTKIDGNVVVLKIVSPRIVHKTEAGGVRFVAKDAASVNGAIQEMLAAVPKRFQAWAQNSAKDFADKPPSLKEITEGIRGILVCEKVDFDKAGYGEEIMLGTRNSREFGPIVTMGVGGVDVEYMSQRLKPGRAQAIGSAHLLERENILPSLEPLVFFGKMAAGFRGRRALIKGEALAKAFAGFQQLAAHFSPYGCESPYIIEELEANPLVVRGGKLIPLDGLGHFSRSHREVKRRPGKNIRHLLMPQTIGIIGVSEKINIGHTILNNILENGFPGDKVFVVKPGLREIEGCACFPSIADLPQTVDLFVLTLAADQSLQVMKELVEEEKARSVIIIAGGLGEKKGTQDIEAGIKKIIQDNRDQGKPTPVVNGGNCLGIYSRPGKYDTTFIPELKFPRPRGPESGLVYISQSGAYMITRMSRLPHIVPLYAVSLGNQIDLTASDYLEFLKSEREAKMFALYIEGFHAGDGLALAKAASEIAKQKGKAIVAYKAGKTPEGRTATSSHTASVAGDYDVAKAVLEEAGVVIAETVFEFESHIKGMVYLADKKIRGNRVGLISNAGFECVIMADNLKNDTALALASLSPATVQKMSRILRPLGIDRIQDVRNPIDITPVGDDAVFCECVRALLEDDNVDCAVVSPVPMTPAMQTLPPGEGYGESIYSPQSTPRRLIEIFRGTDKPFVVNVDAGASYQPMIDLLEKEGVPTFSRCDDAVKFLRKYINSRMKK